MENSEMSDFGTNPAELKKIFAFLKNANNLAKKVGYSETVESSEANYILSVRVKPDGATLRLMVPFKNSKGSFSATLTPNAKQKAVLDQLFTFSFDAVINANQFFELVKEVKVLSEFSVDDTGIHLYDEKNGKSGTVYFSPLNHKTIPRILKESKLENVLGTWFEVSAEELLSESDQKIKYFVVYHDGNYEISEDRMVLLNPEVALIASFNKKMLPKIEKTDKVSVTFFEVPDASWTSNPDAIICGVKTVSKSYTHDFFFAVVNKPQ